MLLGAQRWVLVLLLVFLLKFFVSELLFGGDAGVLAAKSAAFSPVPAVGIRWNLNGEQNGIVWVWRVGPDIEEELQITHASNIVDIDKFLAAFLGQLAVVCVVVALYARLAARYQDELPAGHDGKRKAHD